MAADAEPLTSSPRLPGSWQGPSDFMLSNGLRVVFVGRENAPIVEFRYIINGGFAADPAGRSGLSAFAMAMFSEGLIRVDNVQIGGAIEAAGAVIHGQPMPDAAVVGMSALKANLVDALTVYADALKNPQFKSADIELLRANRLASIAGERLDSFELGLRFLPPMVYGSGHIYARPFTGSGTDKDVAAITADDLRSYYAADIVPQRSTLVIAGPHETQNLRAQLEKAFGKSQAAPRTATAYVTSESTANRSAVMIVNRANAPQTILAAGLRTFARNSSLAEALMVADAILGGSFSSRLNMSLRERKGWTYGVRSSLIDTRWQGLWLIRTAVRSDSATQAMAEITGEIQNLARTLPASPDEFSRAVNYLVARIPSGYETCAQMADALAHSIICGLPIRYTQILGSRLRRVSPHDVTDTCRQILAAGGLQWLVVGQAAELISSLRDAGFKNIGVIE
jgi:zinc protease